MAKGGRGGKRRGGGGGGGGKFSNAPNPYQIPEKLDEAIGTRGTPKSPGDALVGTNPYYSNEYKEFSENCQRCVMAYEMRRRGYDVEALPTFMGDDVPKNGRWQTALSGMTPSSVGRSTERATINAIVKRMEEWGDGARAILRVKWAGENVGHVVNVENIGGVIKLYDAQDSKRTQGLEWLKESLPFTTLSQTMLYRTDNATVTDWMRLMVKKK